MIKRKPYPVWGGGRYQEGMVIGKVNGEFYYFDVSDKYRVGNRFKQKVKKSPITPNGLDDLADKQIFGEK